MSEMLNANIGRKVSEVSPVDLKMLIAGFMDSANRIMGTSADDRELSWLIDWTIRFITERYNYLPMHYVRSAIENGALGERGGTSKLMPRNIAIWFREQAGIMQEVQVHKIKAEDDKARIENFNTNKAEWQVAAAVRIKVGWLGDGLITSEEYDSFSSKAIYDLIKSGMTEGEIKPAMVVPNYKRHREAINPL